MPRVVVISKSGMVRFQCKRELAPRGYHVVDMPEAFTPAAVVRSVERARADVVIVDGNASSASSRFLLRTLKDAPSIGRTPVLFLADDRPDHREAILSAGADGVIPRADDFDAVAATLALHLKR